MRWDARRAGRAPGVRDARPPALLFAEEELVALAQEGVGVGPLVERPDQHARLAGRHLPHDPLNHRRLSGTARRHQRPHAIGRGHVRDPFRQLLHQRLAAAEVRRRLERVDDADLALPVPVGAAPMGFFAR